MKILVDTLSISFKWDAVGELYELLNLYDLNFEPTRNRNYKDGQYHPGINIMYNFDEFNNVTDTFLHLSGRGCRLIEQINPGFDWFEFLHHFDTQIRNGNAHIARIDIACDVDDGSIKIGTVQKYSMAEMYVCRSKVLPLVQRKRIDEVYFGSPKSDRFLRIYDKALEMGLPDTDWVRFEFQLRNDNATSWYLNWCEHRNDIGKLYSGIMIDYLRFVSVPRGCSMKEIRANKNQSKLLTAPWWERFIGDAERIPQLYLPGQEYTLERLEYYLEHNVASSIKAYIEAHDGDIGKLLDAVSRVQLNTKQKLMLAELQMLRAEREGKQIE